ncbi:hypothetical protein [Microbispora sp. ATCC PTA-5024]|uniref:hypothetical protein n=1 Tax=Microbispora sp. ATCC PTA-5024 TaxID=316330 RepID=UPI001E305780|nr:hypothetical protein [Microbispora sp. ATCC PTA-5024]
MSTGPAETSRSAEAPGAPAEGATHGETATGTTTGRPKDVSAADVAARVESCPDVVRLSRGPFGAVATYLPGGLVPGVVVRDDRIEIHIVARYGRPLPETAEAVRDAVADLADGRPVDVIVADVENAGGTREEG